MISNHHSDLSVEIEPHGQFMKIVLLTIAMLLATITSCSWFNKPIDCSNGEAQKIVSKIIIEQTQKNYQQKSKNVADDVVSIINHFNIRYEFARPLAYDANLKKYECVANTSIVFTESFGLTDLMTTLSSQWAEIEQFNSSGLSNRSMPFYGIVASKFASNHSLKKMVNLNGVTIGSHFISKPIKFSVQETGNNDIYVEVAEWEALVDAATVLMAIDISKIPADITPEEKKAYEKYLDSREGKIEICMDGYAEDSYMGDNEPVPDSATTEPTPGEIAKWKTECEASIPKQ